MRWAFCTKKRCADSSTPPAVWQDPCSAARRAEEHRCHHVARPHRRPLPTTATTRRVSIIRRPAWFLDTDYDGATFLVRQAYFTSQTTNPWETISKALEGSVDPEQFAALQRVTSLPCKAARRKQCAAKAIDHRGNEVMTVLLLS